MKQHKCTIAKISQPRLSTVLNRTRLFHRIDKFIKNSAIWICGSPGAGKTTLAASYIKHHKIPSIWYQMDSADSEAASFFHYMTLAAAKALGNAPDALPRIAKENLLNLPEFALYYFRELFGQLKKPFVIVLDNYHEVPSDSIIHELIKAGLEQVPGGLNLLILSRTEPPPVMARLLVNQCLATILPQELSLTEQESIGIAALTEKWKPCPESVANLHRFTKGWTAGLVLMLEYATPDDATPLSRKGKAAELFFNYFAGEIFNKMEPAVQQFLLKISCMPSFTPHAAAKLTGFENSGEILAEMNRKNYFTLKKIEKSTFYQFHPLFRTFLRTKAEESLEAELLIDLYQAAADMSIEQGQLEDGFQLYAKIDNRDAQATLIRDHAASLIAEGRVGIVTRWLNALPREYFESDPWLLYIYGQCFLPFDTKTSRAALIKAYEHFKRENDYTAMALAGSMVVDTVITEWGDYKQLDPWIRVLDDIVENHGSRLSGEVQAKAEYALFISLIWRQPNHHYLEFLVKRMSELLQSDADPHFRIMVGNFLLHYLSWKGDMFQARIVIAIIRDLVKRFKLSPLVFVTAKTNVAIYQWFTADLDGCLETVGQGLEVAQKNGVHLLDNLIMAQEVYARLSLGAPASAGPLLDKMSRILNTTRHLDISHYNFLRSAYHLQTGDHDLALRHITESLRAAETMGTPFPEGLNCIAAARVHLQLGDVSKARAFNDRAKKIGLAMESAILEMLSLFNEAFLHLKTDHCGQARACLASALKLQKENNLINFPTWHDAFIQDLYEAALRWEIEVEYVQSQIRVRGLRPRNASVSVENWPWRLRLYTLGRFELLVDEMPLVSKGMIQQKPLNLLKALISLGAKDVAADRLEDILWPDAEGDKAHRALITTLYRLRKLTGGDRTIVFQDATMSLNPRDFWTDVWAFEHLCDQIDQLKREDNFDNGASAGLAQKLLDYYRGDFLKDQENLSWTLPLREKLRSKFKWAIIQIARERIRKNRHEQAIQLYLRGLEVDELAEEIYQDLMTCYQNMGRITEGLSIYQRCRDTFLAVLGTRPSMGTEHIRIALSGPKNGER
jgi:ATP/maltotriose-dependent transcriptional regulator MalT/DNA-binding SARP family transcriptional activator